MQIIYMPLLFVSYTTALANPSLLSRRADCTPNPTETYHLGHGHDINTGDLFVGGIVKHAGLKVGGGSGCIPAWDRTRNVVPKLVPKAEAEPTNGDAS
ncbi:hypothetical protein EJ08DRAFT_646185 [Tothia fuscella]|uniref:Uncharacterized protein n=1 Tax=Tothia fuscella TaxID=1048955 RepID=A0A9P4NZW6_9PEZI|nr:hypothetical protein EJ08DRAFT_646185 [Tothia fuscella]